MPPVSDSNTHYLVAQGSFQLDELWLKDFQARKKDVRPGDSIKASVKITVKYGYDSSVIAAQYEILKIEDVIPNEDFNTDMFQ